MSFYILQAFYQNIRKVQGLKTYKNMYDKELSSSKLLLTNSSKSLYIYIYIYIYILVHGKYILYIYIYLWVYMYTGASQVEIVVKNPTNAEDTGDMGSIPGLGRSPGGGHGNPFQYSCLENSMDRGTWQTIVHIITKSWTRLKQLSMHTYAYVYIYIWNAILNFGGFSFVFFH